MTDYDFDTIRCADPDADGILTATLDRPDRLNALTATMFTELGELCRRATEDDTLRVVVLTGAGRGFCAGLDLDEAASIPAMSVTEMYRAQAAGAEAIATVHRLGKPVIAAVNGPAAGGGLALALAADVRLASTEARFGVAFTRLGLSGCDVGVSWLLPRLVGSGVAAELMLTGRVVDANRAERLGLVSEVVAPDDLLPTAHLLALEMARNSPFGLQLTKEGLRLALDAPSLEAAIAVENRNQVLASRTDDMHEALTAFIEKRPARYTGR